MRIKSAVRLSGLFFALFAFTISLAVSVQAQTETTIHSFNNDTNGYNPVASLILDSSGNLYSTTTAGGNFWGCIVGCGCRL